MKSERILFPWKEIHEEFNKLDNEQQVDRIAKIYKAIRKEKNAIVRRHKQLLEPIRDKKAIATLFLCQCIEEVLVDKLGVNGGTEGNEFYIINSVNKGLVIRRKH